jgi:hypothetical protein
MQDFELGQFEVFVMHSDVEYFPLKAADQSELAKPKVLTYFMIECRQFFSVSFKFLAH